MATGRGVTRTGKKQLQTIPGTSGGGGGGGGGSASAVANIAALRTSVSNADSIYVQGYYVNGDNGGGTFSISATDTTSPDDGAEIIINANGKRYYRQWSGAFGFDFRWAGAKGDGATDNASAILRTTYLGRKYSAGGKGFVLVLPPLVFNFNAVNTGYYWWAGIKKFTVWGYGATLKNTYNGGDGNLGRPLFSVLCAPIVNTTGATFHGVIAGNPFSWLINNTAVGDASFTTTTPADAGAWTVGDPVLLTSVDLQYYGYPHNPGNSEYNEVTSVNAGTGVVGLKYPIQNRHLSTYPDGGITAPSSVPCGKARAWKISSAVYYVPDPLNFPAVLPITLPWDIEHRYAGLTIPNSTMAPATYMSINGKSVLFEDCTLIGVSPTVAGDVIFRRCKFTNVSEPDKIVRYVEFDACEGVFDISFQSASIHNVVVKGGRLRSFGAGAAKYVTIENPDIDLFAYGSVFGITRNINIIGGAIRAMTATASDFGTPSNHIDGVQITYANGVIRMLKGAAEQPYWGLVPGTQINILSTADNFSGDTGTGIVWNIREDATYVYFDTTLPWAALPAWAGTKVLVFRGGNINVLNTTGCDTIRNFAQTHKLNLKQPEYYKAQLRNQNTAGGAVTGMVGKITKIVVDVRRASTTATRKVQIDSYLIKDDDFTDQQLMTIKVDISTKGRREYTLAGFTGTVGGDSATFDPGATPITALPPGRTTPFGQVSWTHNVALPATFGQLGDYDIEVYMSIGSFGDMLVHDLDGTVNPITRVTGGVPA